jgi:RNA polymerase sigma-70 factor (ECF subfamily)
MLAHMASDEALMLQYQAGHAPAFDVLYEKYKGDVYRFLLRQLEPAIAEELYQDIWINLINARAQYTVSASFRTYLYSIAHNRLRDYWRKQQHDITETMHEISDTAHVDDINPERVSQDQQAVAALLDGIRLLPAEQQQAFLLKTESGLALEEIAAVMQSSVEATKSRLRYATRKLREHLTGIWP